MLVHCISRCSRQQYWIHEIDSVGRCFQWSLITCTLPFQPRLQTLFNVDVVNQLSSPILHSCMTIAESIVPISLVGHTNTWNLACLQTCIINGKRRPWKSANNAAPIPHRPENLKSARIPKSTNLWNFIPDTCDRAIIGQCRRDHANSSSLRVCPLMMLQRAGAKKYARSGRSADKRTAARDASEPRASRGCVLSGGGGARALSPSAIGFYLKRAHARSAAQSGASRSALLFSIYSDARIFLEWILAIGAHFYAALTAHCAVALLLPSLALTLNRTDALCSTLVFC